MVTHSSSPIHLTLPLSLSWITYHCSSCCCSRSCPPLVPSPAQGSCSWATGLGTVPRGTTSRRADGEASCVGPRLGVRGGWDEVVSGQSLFRTSWPDIGIQQLQGRCGMQSGGFECVWWSGGMGVSSGVLLWLVFDTYKWVLLCPV